MGAQVRDRKTALVHLVKVLPTREHVERGPSSECRPWAAETYHLRMMFRPAQQAIVTET